MGTGTVIPALLPENFGCFFLTGKLTWTKFHQLLFIYLLICILFFGMSNNRLVISSSQLEKLHTKSEESMDDCHPHLQKFSVLQPLGVTSKKTSKLHAK